MKVRFAASSIFLLLLSSSLAFPATPPKLLKQPSTFFNSVEAIPPPSTTRSSSSLTLLLPSFRSKSLTSKTLISTALQSPITLQKYSTSALTVILLILVVPITQNLPPQTPLLLAWLLPLTPFSPIILNFVSPSTLPQLLSKLNYNLSPSSKHSILIHESGHILTSLLFGYNVVSEVNKFGEGKTEVLEGNKGKELSDALGFESEGNDYLGPDVDIEEKINYFDQINQIQENDPRKNWPYRGYTLPEIQKLTIIGLSGLAAELIFTSKISSGSRSDLYRINEIMNFSEVELNDLERERIIEQGLVWGVTEIKRREGGMKMIYESLKNDETVFEIEEERVTEKWEEGYVGEGEDVKIEGRFMEGIITGDDPLYIAIAVAGAFGVWASTGGLTLH
ncbi:hypothetical protein TrLO_g15093 [Triparma laevis f. longispina]|uniref:Uncharacterized protein n=1 Tax=Triparma laevis f. longispina TaxID=1714387 RepID=A0A9W7AFS7_9STRA|nr:hypothetical protein TrLO_g15093 [Triparma laevis f. longispina]